MEYGEKVIFSQASVILFAIGGVWSEADGRLFSEGVVKGVSSQREGECMVRGSSPIFQRGSPIFQKGVSHFQRGGGSPSFVKMETHPPPQIREYRETCFKVSLRRADPRC